MKKMQARFESQDNIAFAKADIGNSHPCRIDSVSASITDYTTTFIPKDNSVFLKGCSPSHPRLYVHECLGTGQNNKIHISVSNFMQKSVYLKQRDWVY